MTTGKRLINPSCFRYVEFEGSYKERPTLPVGDRYKIVGRENHRQRTTREVIDSEFPTELNEKVANRGPRFAIAILRTIAAIDLFLVFF